MGEGPHQDVVECTELSHLADYSQPHAPGVCVRVCACARACVRVCVAYCMLSLYLVI